MRLKELEREWEAKMQIGKGERTSGITEMDAIAGKMVLQFESLEPYEGVLTAMAAAEQMCS